MKKLTIVAFVIILLLPLSARAQALSDIQNHPNQTAIEYLFEKDVISGYPDGSFQPNTGLNRAELLKILVGGKGIKPSDGFRDCFPDVQNQWFARFVCYAKEQNWVQGYKDGTFEPSSLVNKAEAIKMLVESQGFEIPNVVNESFFLM